LNPFPILDRMSRDLGVHLSGTQRLLPRAAQNTEQRGQRRLFGLKSNSTGAIDDKVDAVSLLEAEFPPDFDGNCYSSFAGEGGLRHVPYLLSGGQRELANGEGRGFA